MMLRQIFSLPFARHEARVWRANPSTVVFVGFAWALLSILGFEVGNFFASNRASMEVFFSYLPWVYMGLLPALTMSLWAEDWRKGMAERLLTLPVSLGQLVVTRFMVAWALVGLFLLGTWPLVAAVAWLGSPDWGQIAAGYVGAFLLGGVLLACALLASAISGHAVVAFVVGLTLLGAVMLVGWGWLLDMLSMWVPSLLVGWLREVSVLEHYRRFVVGLVDMRSVACYLALTVLALGLQMAVLARKSGQGRGWTWAAGALLVALLVGWGGAYLPVRWDWTYEDQFTLSPASRELVAHLAKPVTLTVYDSRTNPDVPESSRMTSRRLNDVLREIVALNPAMVTLRVINPDLKVDDELAAQEAGLTEQPLESGQGYYLGVVAEMDGRHTVLPALDVSRMPYLEFDLMSVLAEVQKIGRKHMAVLAMPNLRMRDIQPVWMREMEGFYDISYMRPGEPAVPAGTDVLVVLMAPYLPVESLYAIDQYLVQGGRVMLLMDPYFRTAPAPDLLQPDRNADAFALDHPADLLHAWGVDYDGMGVVADPLRATSVNEPDVGFRTYPFWLNLQPADVNHALPFTSYVENLQLPEPGRFTLGTLATGLTATPVLTSSDKAQVLPRAMMDNNDPQLYASKLTDEPQRRVLAMMLGGRFPSVFTDVPPAVKHYYEDYAGEGQPVQIPPHISRSEKRGTVLAIADEDFLDLKFTARPSGRAEGELEPINDNLVFFYNALQYLAGEGELLALRGKAAVPRTFTRVDAMLARLSGKYAKIERRMAADLFQVGQKLDELKKQQEGDGTQSVGADMQTELRAYQGRNLQLRKELRDVRKSLRRDVLRVETVLMLFTALAMPLLAGLGWWLWRRKRG